MTHSTALHQTEKEEAIRRNTLQVFHARDMKPSFNSVNVTCKLNACAYRNQYVAKLSDGCLCTPRGRTPMTFAYSIRMSPPRYRKAIQFASGHSAQFACSVGQSFSCGNMEYPRSHARQHCSIWLKQALESSCAAAQMCCSIQQL